MMDPDVLKAILEQNQLCMKQMMDQCKKLFEGISNKDTSTSTAPSFPPFNKEKDNWKTYLAQLTQHFEAHKISDDNQKRACFLSWIGAENFEILQKLFGGEELHRRTFKELCDKLSEYFVSKMHVLAARYEFHKNLMKSGQSYSEWVADLRGIARNCLFTCTNSQCNQSFVDYMIRDVVVLHTPHDTVRAQALQKTNPTLNEVLEIAQVYETTLKSCSTIKGDVKVDVHYTKPQQVSTRQYSYKSCPQCFLSHLRENCRHLKSICNKCGKKGHIGSVCLSNKSSENTNKQQQYTQQGKRHHRHRRRGKESTYTTKNVRNQNVNIAGKIRVEENIAGNIFCVDKVREKCSGDLQNQVFRENNKFMIRLCVNNKWITFQIDTGATRTLIGLQGYREFDFPYLNVNSNTVLTQYNGDKLKVKGEIEVKIVLPNRLITETILVIDSEKGLNLLGVN